MAKDLKNLLVDNFSTGLNVVDSPHDMEQSDLQIADNVTYRPTGEVESIEGLLEVGNEIYVNDVISSKILGGIKFQGIPYLMASNGSEARLVYLNQFLTGSISQFSDGGGGQVTVTDANHGLHDNDSITISGTTNYNGTYTITNTTTNTFEITATFNGDDGTGS